MSRAALPDHKHISFDRDGNSWACPLAPHDRDWDWEDGVVAYLDRGCVWALKTLTLIATGGGRRPGGVWLGPQASHDSATMLAEVDPSDPCPCGSGDRFEDCHRTESRIRAAVA